jgi:O-antigen ligase
MMATSMGKDKDMHVPSKLFMVNKDAVNAMPVAALIVVLFPVLVTNFLTISLYLFITIFFFLRSSKILLTRDLLKTAMIMLSGVLIMAYSYDKEPVINYLMWSPPDQSSILTSMLLTSVICFIVFIQGYFYSFTVKSPLSFLGYVFLYQWALLSIYFIVAYGFYIGNSLMMGNITIILIPYMYLVFDGKPKLRFIFSSIVLLYLMLILCRTAFVAAVIFFLTYYLYPYLIVNKIRYKLFFLSFIMLIFLFISIYLLSGFDFLADISDKYFGGKGLGRGRDLIWPELLLYIIDKPLFGYGINQASEYLQSTAAIMGYRDLSSHNIYLETLLRGGILLLSFFIILFYRIWGSFYSINNNKISRIAASGFSAFLFVGAGLPIGLIDNIVLNTPLWFYWGVASGSSWINNHQHVVPV